MVEFEKIKIKPILAKNGPPIKHQYVAEGGLYKIRKDSKTNKWNVYKGGKLMVSYGWLRTAMDTINDWVTLDEVANGR
jgi:hypothetical protein